MTTVGIVAGSDDRNQLALHPGFVEAVLAAGGLPVLLPKTYGGRIVQLEKILQAIDALILVGGGDIGCDCYGEAPTATLQEVDHVRDDMELYAARWAVRNNIRVLGVCRGAQIIAVATARIAPSRPTAAGYYGHLSHLQGAPFGAMRHQVQIRKGTLAAQVLEGVDEVNSHHHQAISDPGSLLQATGWGDDGVIEVVEAENALGIQWHPELLLLPDDRRPLKPFAWVVGNREMVG